MIALSRTADKQGQMPGFQDETPSQPQQDTGNIRSTQRVSPFWITPGFQRWDARRRTRRSDYFSVQRMSQKQPLQPVQQYSRRPLIPKDFRAPPIRFPSCQNGSLVNGARLVHDAHGPSCARPIVLRTRRGAIPRVSCVHRGKLPNKRRPLVLLCGCYQPVCLRR